MTRAAVSILLIALAAGSAEIIDRVAVSVDNTVIPASEVVRQIRITAFLNNEEPNVSPDRRREAAERLVDQMLIRREINSNRYVPNDTAQAEEMFRAFRARYKTDSEYRTALARYHLTEADIKEAFNWQATFLDFVEVRFRPGITIPEEEIRAAYEQELRGKTSPEAGLSYEEARPRIEQTITQQRVDNALDRWLGQTRTQSRILYRREAFE